MRIAYLNQTYPPMVNGVSVSLQSQARGLAARGHNILVVTASDRQRPYLALEGNLTILRLPSIHNPLRVGQRAVLYPRRAIAEALNDFRPHVIHTHEALQMSWIGASYARRAGIPIVLTIPALPSFFASYLPLIPGLRKAIESALWTYGVWTIRRMNAAITPTRTISNLLKDRTGIQPYTISNGVDAETFHPRLSSDGEAATRRKWNLPAAVPILLHVGRLDPEKAVDRVIRAAAPALTRSSAHLLIVGDGSRRAALEKLSRSLGLEMKIHFLGYVSAAQGLPDIHRLSRLFISACACETQGLVLLEAAASGLPIVAVRGAAVPEIVHHGRNGLLSEPGDVAGMAENILRLTQDVLLARRMGAAGRRLVRAHDHSRTLDLHENLYAQLVAAMGIPVSLRRAAVARGSRTARIRGRLPKPAR